MNVERANVWLAFASAAIAGRSGKLDKVMDEACEVADEMLEEYEARFGPNAEDPEEEDVRVVRRRR